MTRLENIGNAAAGIAHDLNNHLTLILNHLAFDQLDEARAATNRCCALTKSLLAYSSGRKINRAPVDLSRLLRNIFYFHPIPAGIHVTLSAPENLPRVSADADAIERVLINLVSNAFHAVNNEGNVSIRVSRYLIEVEDDGPGIAPENLARIFEPFFSTKGEKGTGLGLAIVRDIMREHGGTVTVDSEPGRGTVFQLKFPAAFRPKSAK